MIVDAHTHILTNTVDPAYRQKWNREGSLAVIRSRGDLPATRMPSEDEWKEAETRLGVDFAGVTTPQDTLNGHPGFDKVVVLAESPRFLDGQWFGTVDPSGITGVTGDVNPERCNEYTSAFVQSSPENFIGFASVNPLFRGVKAAVAELGRAVEEYGLKGVKLYPMYQHWNPDDPEVAFPIYSAARDLGIPVMIHQAGSTTIDGDLRCAEPWKLDAIGREFRDLKVIVAHCGFPRIDETLHLLSKHANFYGELSYYIATVTPSEFRTLLHHARRQFVPIEKLIFGTDSPGFLYDAAELRKTVENVNDGAVNENDRISDETIGAIMGNTFMSILPDAA
jgi:predicted TIM-barrel fold metal-dependent hydrolase